MKTRKRLDTLLVERGLAKSRSKACALIRTGRVLLPYGRPTKPGVLVSSGEEIRLREAYPYVGRGGEKLDHFLDAACVVFQEKVVLDIGSSTGGFTQVALKRGAKRVYCVDVGKGLLHWSLRQNRRVIIKEGINFRYAQENLLPEKVDIALMDVSFISAKLLVPKVLLFLKKRGRLVLLVKPQFELTPDKVKNGVVKDEGLIREAVDRVKTCLSAHGFGVLLEKPSVIKGKKKNQEVFLLAQLQ